MQMPYIGAGACTEIEDLCLKKRSGYIQTNFVQILLLVKFLYVAATPMLYLGICRSFSDINYAAHRHLVCYVLILILANFHAITKIIFTKILSYENLELYGICT